MKNTSRDRSGKQVVKVVSGEKALGYLYNTRTGRTILKIITRRSVSKVTGKILSSKVSRIGIRKFVKKNNINVEEYEDRKYISYNDFFTRKLKPGKRMICMAKSALICPCDGRLSVYNIEENSIFFIKESAYTIADLVENQELAREYVGGTCLIFRLSVDDYHRYCYFDWCHKSENTFIKGVLHTVNPIVLDKYNVYKKNCREYTILETENFDKAVQIEVGAMLVGRIKNLHGEGNFNRGAEKGMFEFGGSTIVLLLKKDVAEIDADIIQNSSENVETIVKMGERIGVSLLKHNKNGVIK
jgi:phosphatidylserine decarboxylase